MQRCPLSNLHHVIPIYDLVSDSDRVQMQGRDMGSLKPGEDGVVTSWECPLFATSSSVLSLNGVPVQTEGLFLQTNSASQIPKIPDN